MKNKQKGNGEFAIASVVRVSRRAARRCGARVCAVAVGGGLARAASQLPRPAPPPMVGQSGHVTRPAPADACLQIIIIRRGRCGAARSVALRATHSCRCIWRDSIRNEHRNARSKLRSVYLKLSRRIIDRHATLLCVWTKMRVS